jgi:3-methyladenine DNA glycosylase AlkD
MREMVDLLMEHQDKSYAEFMSRLLPNLAPELVIGVRTPELRKMAKQLMKEHAVGAEKIDVEAFLKELPHAYFEENQLHGFMISEMKDFDVCIRELEAFLPYIDNWATCDQTSPKIFKKRGAAAVYPAMA